MKRRIIKVAAVAALMLLSFLLSGSRSDAGSVTTVVASQGFVEAAYGFSVGEFRVTGVDGKTYPAYCACHELALPPIGMQMQTSVCTNSNIRKVLYYGFGGPANRGFTYTQTAVAVSVANGHLDADITGESLRAVGKPMLDQVSRLPDPGNVFTVYYAKSTDGAKQDLVYFVYRPTGKLSLVKESADRNLTDGNGCYRLDGAEYGVYKDAECVDRVSSLRTGTDGRSNEVELDAGTYYVCEITAPVGYAIDKTVHKVVLKGGGTAVVRAEDAPQVQPMALLLEKYDSERAYAEGNNRPQGSAALGGAQYTVRYYAGLYQTEEELKEKTPTRSWVFRTDDAGRLMFDKDSLISGDALWTDRNGRLALPLGTVTLRESKAPEGYHLSEELFIRQITPDGTGEEIHSYRAPAAPEDIIRGDLELIKVYQPEDRNDDVLEPIEGVEFTITSDTTGQEVLKIVTDRNGKATTRSDAYPRGRLVYDTYTITETKTPDGYRPIRPFKVSIRQEQVTVAGIYRQDTLITSPIQVVKVDQSTGEIIPQAGITFRLLDADRNIVSMTTHYPSTQELKEFQTDEEGKFVFPEALRAGTYYLQEVKAPEGYVRNEEEIEFQVREGADWEHPLVIRMENEPAMGRVKLKKTDEATGEPLSGVVFDVIAKEDIVTPDGTVRAKKGETVEELTTDENGEVQSGKLYLGSYELKEQNTPEGYIVPDEPVPFELIYKDQETEVVEAEVDISNKPTEIIIQKIDRETGQPLEGVTFYVFEKSDAEESQESLKEEQLEEPDVAEESEEPESTAIENVKKPQESTVDESVKKPQERTADENAKKPQESTVDENVKKPQEDATDENAESMQEYTTDENGKIYLTYIPRGTVLCIREKEALPGYVLDETVHEVSIDENGRIDGEERFLLLISNKKEPEQPETPEKPDQPKENPPAPQPGRPAKTGDGSRAELLTLACILSCCVAAAIMKRRKSRS